MMRQHETANALRNARLAPAAVLAADDPHASGLRRALAGPRVFRRGAAAMGGAAMIASIAAGASLMHRHLGIPQPARAEAAARVATAYLPVAERQPDSRWSHPLVIALSFAIGAGLIVASFVGWP